MQDELGMLTVSPQPRIWWVVCLVEMAVIRCFWEVEGFFSACFCHRTWAI